jgi:hypothetical protein
VHHTTGREAWRRVDLVCTVGAFYTLSSGSGVFRAVLRGQATSSALYAAVFAFVLDLLFRKASSRIHALRVNGPNLHLMWHAHAAWAAYNIAITAANVVAKRESITSWVMRKMGAGGW